MIFYQIVFFIAVFSLSYYLLYLIIFHFGLKKGSGELNYRKKTVSIIIAARNEESDIGRLLTSLVNQSYPNELYEIIIADDRSTDLTAQIVSQFAVKWSNVHLVKVTTTVPGFSPKKYALSLAIRESKGEIILLTDADCLVTKYWIESMISNFRDNISMVAGFSRIQIPKWSKGNLLQKFEFCDFLLMFMAAAGAILSGKYFSCSNQNLAYMRSAFDQVGGFEKIKHLLSGDDVNLMQLFRRQGFQVSFSLINHSFVYTQPVTSISHLISQRSRWASNAKWQPFLNPEFFCYLSAVFILQVSMLVLIFLTWKLALLVFGMKILAEYIFVSAHFAKFEAERRRLSFLPVWSLIQPLYILTVTIRGLFNIFSWKP